MLYLETDGVRSTSAGVGGRLHAITRIGVGGTNSGIPFHAHELALNIVFGGRKLWLVARPNDHQAWDDLHETTRLNWGALGWTRRSWEGEEPPPDSDDMDWADLSSRQVQAAIQLGYTELTWDAEDRDQEDWEDLLPAEEARIQEYVSMLEDSNENMGDNFDGAIDNGALEDWRRREGQGHAWRCTQQPGEVVFVPQGFLHTTINVDESFAVAIQDHPSL